MDAENAYIDCNKRKTKECDLLPIREAELKSILGQIAGKKDKVSKIILYDDHIDFFMTDGTARTHIREYPKGTYYQTPFSRKIFCGCCGSSIVRMANHGRPVWICNAKKCDRHACTHKYMKEKELYEAAKWAVDADENLEMQIFCRIGKTVSYNDRIDFYMKEGGVRTWQRQ